MKSRVKKWKHYRDRIASSSFPVTSNKAGSSSLLESDLRELGKLERSSEAIYMADEKALEGTPYDRYVKGKRRNFFIKFSFLVLAVILLVIFYLFFVR